MLSGTNYWSSAIPDIRSIVVQPWGGVVITSSSTGFSVVWTASSGTIHLLTDASTSGTGYILWVLSGGAATKE